MIPLLVLPALLATAALRPPHHSGPAASSRRAALQAAASAAVLPVVSKVARPAAAAIAPSYDDDVKAGLGQIGALRPDEPESLTGSAVDIVIKDLSYVELDACPKNFFIPPKAGPWICLEVSATAVNQGKREVQACDVFGQLVDAEGFSASSTALDPSQKTPFATLEATFPKGKPMPVKWTCTVQARSARPFRFAGIKGTYRNLAMARTFKAFDDCEIDSSLCAEDEEQPSNANALREGKGFNYKQ
jgi:hypothetical protein